MRKKQVKCFIRFCSKELVDKLHRLGDMLCCDSDKANINKSVPSWRLSTAEEIIGMFEQKIIKNEYILCAAIKRKEPKTCEPYWEGTNDICNIEIGYRHHDIFQRFEGEVSNKPLDQGFYTSSGRFVDRKEAMKVAFEAGQVTAEKALMNGKFCNLYSVDLY